MKSPSASSEQSALQIGTLHPITQYLRRAIAVFTQMGFEVLDSPEIALERHNFDDMLIPPDHAGRSMQDTFWLKDGRLPRTHTSAAQVPAMQTRKPPVRLIIPGRVFRNERTDARHETMFCNLEGLVIDSTANLATLKGTLTEFFKRMYGEEQAIKFMPDYFPYVEPGIQAFTNFQGKWMEVLGAGMVHPGVLENMGLNPQEHQGFAFGMGIDRMVMLAHGIDDIRYLYSGNLRFLRQFQEQA